MTSPSPSDLCWVIGFTPNGSWIATVIRAAVGEELERARWIASRQLGDERLASEVMELAIQRTSEYLAELSPIGIEETRIILLGFFRNEVRRRQRTDRRLSFRGSITEVDSLSASNDASFDARDAQLDLASILRETDPEVRVAMLLRYGARSRWSEVAEEMSKSTEAARKICVREMRRIRKALGL